MLDNITSTDIGESARLAAGNWRKFSAFAWHEEPEDADRWMIINTVNRDSGLREQSNHAAIRRTLEPYMGGDNATVRDHGASHWACGWVEGFEVRVYDADGQITGAFHAVCSLADALAEYAVLDESDCSAREYAAALQNIDSVGGNHVKARPPRDWAERVFGWLWANEQSECEDDGQDQGAYPSEESVLRALAALRLLGRDGRAAYRQIA